MKITDVKTYITQLPGRGPWQFVEVYTDEGLTGLGECTWSAGNFLIQQVVESVKPLVVGQDPANIEEIWQLIYRRHLRIGGRGPVSAAISGIDIALWDIKGKALCVPVYQLLGGPVRESVPLYTHVQDARQDATIDEAIAMALATKADGHQAIKTDPFLDMTTSGKFKGASLVEKLTPAAISYAVEWVSALREALGPDFELMIDAHARFDVASAIAAARALEPLGLTWFEEPVPQESYVALKEFRENTNVAVSVGESLFTRYDFVPIFEERLADFVMPDIAWTGGISELRRIAAMAESYYVPFTPHDAIGPVAIASTFQVCMATPNLYRQECLHNWFDDFATIVTPMFEHHDGAIWPSDRPGIGIELIHEEVERHAVSGHMS
ncbi:MAG: mandelate racemase/muconate lactonizing enzyme family protein [SAR202 cluster bacterium]|jgi:galactonate dehydratase|nr:mandelate racemase/muconate lactonizing enzyme family protein [SAR202 cluster bacterium]HAL48187.1 mandelate racemase [Dehalococcoidia bacterium]MDP6665425.1 mandelate racemase/muconate lactonizing enzyme family protein [SAR202 cluster bacterium]MDP6798219.1 mandelate racemase/muconate lactonizing enzyme family protein [SAR202 cluster bacterium]MQG58911.1 mandelate racemase/muconate lactonizing enzyme family protein [SAR202 cluster bacterium]|tara:strand:+ start:1138 stop:2283 length:1146 start_codon:yes stop_codon:yes gene_type:complete